MPLRIRASSVSLPRRMFAALLLIVSIMSCVLALPNLVAHGNVETPVVVSSQANGAGVTAADRGTVRLTAASPAGSALLASPQAGSANGALLANAPVQNYNWVCCTVR